MANKSYNDPFELSEIFRQADARATVLADELFGEGEPTEPELEIIFAAKLSHSDKLTKLKILRGESVKPRSFKYRLTEGDFLRARALGISLEDDLEQARR